MQFLPYDAGALPTSPPPNPGDSITINVEGWPPLKDVSASIRNRKHRHHGRYLTLRHAAIAAMNGRAWYAGGVTLDLTVFAPPDSKWRPVVEYLGGVMDTLDGSHGFTFTHLPVVFEDDCQVVGGISEIIPSEATRYQVVVTFLGDGKNSSGKV